MNDDSKYPVTLGKIIEFMCKAYEIANNYPVTVEELIYAMQVYAEWQENVCDADLEETLWMDDGTPMTPALTRYLYHQMYGLSDIYENDEEDGDDE